MQAHLPVSEAEFPSYIQSIDRETDRRVRDGELEHLVYFVLQSHSFTKRAPIEPALSVARRAEVLERFDDFQHAALGSQSDTRLRYFRSLGVDRVGFEGAWRRALAFLSSMNYESRGHSSDTRMAASFTVWNAIQVLNAVRNAPIRRVLIVGPGADLAPRTAFDDRVPPQTYQPYAVADALGADAAIDCADVNERVLDTVRATRKPVLRVEAGSAEFIEYQRGLAARKVKPDIRALRLNVVTERLDGKYDLVIATNVLLYFPVPQLALALANIEAMIAPGGYLVHNDVRLETEQFTRELGMRWLQGRRVMIAHGAKGPLWDVFGVLEKK